MRWLAIALFAVSFHAHARLFHSSELEALAAPIALHPDPVVWAVLDASLAPYDAPRMLAAYPDITAHMARNPQWIVDLGQAYGAQRSELVAALQVLRQRAGVPSQYVVVQPPAVVVVHPPVFIGAPPIGHRPHHHARPHLHPHRPRPHVHPHRFVPESRRQPIVQPFGVRRSFR